MQVGNEGRTGIAVLPGRDQRGGTRIHPAGMAAILVILVLLPALIVSRSMTRPDEVRRIISKQNIGTIMQALNSYRRDNGRYPTQAQGLDALIKKPNTDPVPSVWKEGGYLERLPNDPWGHAYLYLNPGVHSGIDVFSYGGDARQGGEGNDADIGSWE